MTIYCLTVVYDDTEEEEHIVPNASSVSDAVAQIKGLTVYPWASVDHIDYEILDKLPSYAEWGG